MEAYVYYAYIDGESSNRDGANCCVIIQIPDVLLFGIALSFGHLDVSDFYLSNDKIFAILLEL